MATTRSTKKTDPAEEPASAEEPAPAEELTYEQARDELISVVDKLESGTATLADSMALFKRGEFLAALCENYLTEARATVEAATTQGG